MRCFRTCVHSSGVGARMCTHPWLLPLAHTRLPNGLPTHSWSRYSFPIVIGHQWIKCTETGGGGKGVLTFMGKHPKRLWMFCFASTYTAFMASNCSYTMTRSPSTMQGGGAPRSCFLCRTMAVAPVELRSGALDHVFVSVVEHIVLSSRPPLELADLKVH